MKEESKLALIVGFYLSKFDEAAYDNLGFGTQTSTHKGIGVKLGVKPSTVRNMRDQYDPYHDNTRKGWYQTELSTSREEVMAKYKNCSEQELRKKVKEILSIDFSDME